MSAVMPAANGALRRPRPGAPAASGAAAKPGATATATRGERPPVRRERPAPPSVPPPDPAFAEIDALAFATDPTSEHALREGLADFQDAQVWPGDLRAAAAALEQGHAPRLVFVDIDGTSYPAGAIYELSAVCEVGTLVIALGSDDTARHSREILLAGVSDYLVKPITAAAVREAAARAVGTAANDSLDGWLTGFAGTGGSGTTTLAAATALLAAERGRYVSVLDLNRSFPALAFALDVEPAGGLVDLLSTAARASLHPEMVDGMRAERSGRIAVYGYPWSAVPPPLAPVWAVGELFAELQRRSHLVIVDGMDDPATRQALLAMVDARVLVVEPTATGAASAARMMARLRPMTALEWPVVLVCNHTRPIPPKAAARALAEAGVAARPDVVVPFEPGLPPITDRGWPRGRLPRALRGPLDRLADRVLAMPGREGRMADMQDGARAQAAATGAPPRAGKPRAPRKSAASSATASRPSPVRAALRRLLPSRAARSRPA